MLPMFFDWPVLARARAYVHARSVEKDSATSAVVTQDALPLQLNLADTKPHIGETSAVLRRGHPFTPPIQRFAVPGLPVPAQ
jgi:hypothetical protein